MTTKHGDMTTTTSTFKFTDLKGKEFQMSKEQFKRLFDMGLGTQEERSHLMQQALEQGL